jgi:hypothetical protein
MYEKSSRQDGYINSIQQLQIIQQKADIPWQRSAQQLVGNERFSALKVRFLFPTSQLEQ